jgi:pimeloyl-ACP methyl ester carboxylesterase
LRSGSIGANFRSGSIRANDIDFEYVEQGAGPLVLLFHGFPDSPLGWRYQLPALAAAGFRAVAPVLRFYGPAALSDSRTFATSALGLDAVALIDAFGAERATLVGHDWGVGAVTAAALLAPARVERLVTIAVPYGRAMAQALVENAAQRRRSWYMYYLAGPLGEAGLSADDFALIDELWRDWSPGYVPDPEFMRDLKARFAAPGVAGAVCALYHNSLYPADVAPELKVVQNRLGREPLAPPALHIHGANDGCIGADVGRANPKLFAGGIESVVVPAAGHFVHLECPDAVNARLVAFLKK